MKSLIAFAGKASPSQVETLQEVCLLCEKIFGEQDLQIQQLVQLILMASRIIKAINDEEP